MIEQVYHHDRPKRYACYSVTLCAVVRVSRSWCRRPYNLYCVGGDVKPCSINQSIKVMMMIIKLKDKYLKNNAFWRQNYYRTLRNH